MKQKCFQKNKINKEGENVENWKINLLINEMELECVL